jgi:hypothetical protein
VQVLLYGFGGIRYSGAGVLAMAPQLPRTMGHSGVDSGARSTAESMAIRGLHLGGFALDGRGTNLFLLVYILYNVRYICVQQYAYWFAFIVWLLCCVIFSGVER